MRSNVWARLMVLLAGIAAIPASGSQAFPTKPLRIIVPAPPGGLNDTFTRHIGQLVSVSVGQPVIIENRPGAGSMIAMSALAKAQPDGYTIAITTAEPLLYNPFLYKRLPYDPDNDFSYVSQLVKTQGFIVAHPGVKGDTFPEVLAYAKANPGKLNWATWGPGSTPSIFLEWIKLKNNVDIVAVQYKGAAPSVPAMLSGETHLTYSPVLLSLPLIKAGKLKAIAVTGTQPSPSLPNVPPLTTYDSDPLISGGFSAYGPAGIPPRLLNRVAGELITALKTPHMQKIITEGALIVVGSTPAEFAKQFKADRANAARVFKALRVTPQDVP